MILIIRSSTGATVEEIACLHFIYTSIELSLGKIVSKIVSPTVSR